MAIAKADCFVIRPDLQVVDKNYLCMGLVSEFCFDQLKELTHGATRPRINTTQLRSVIIPLCPIDEQKEIVHRVEKLFKAIDLMEQEYQKASKLCDRLEQATLAKAFRGELVPQDPKDEPAAALLERILTEQPASKSKTVKSKQKPGGQS
jgi:type I restriction enzyme S subunit